MYQRMNIPDIFVLDTEADVADLPTNVEMGSMAIICKSSDETGIGRVIYMLNSQKQWVK